MTYDNFGILEKEHGKKRLSTPRAIDCECGRKTEKIAYGTYECLCGKCYMFRWGKLETGKVIFQIENFGTLNKEVYKMYEFGNQAIDLISLS